jgi:hypothetical protein
MGHTGWKFAADLGDLEAIAKVDLRGIADDYGKFNHEVVRAADNDLTAFSASGSLMGNYIYSSLKDLRDILQDVYARSASRIEDTADIISHIAHAYATADGYNAAQLRSTVDHVRAQYADKRKTYKQDRNEAHMPVPEAPPGSANTAETASPDYRTRDW